MQRAEEEKCSTGITSRTVGPVTKQNAVPSTKPSSYRFWHIPSSIAFPVTRHAE